MRTSILALLGLSFVGCGTASEEANENNPFGTGAMLSVDYFGDTDVEGFRFDLYACDGGDLLDSFIVDLVDGIFPGNIQFVESVLDEDSRHIGSDLFVTLDPGCYEVTATPVRHDDAGYVDSEDCAPVSSGEIEVAAEQTTEAPVLVSQCVGDPIGALDQLVVINHPPQLDVSFGDDKFGYECELIEICIDAWDIDNDPVLLTVEQLSGAWDIHFADDINQWVSNPADLAVYPDAGLLTENGAEDGHINWQVCFDVWTAGTDSFDLKATVQDLDADGIPFEDGHTAGQEIDGNPVDSNAMLTFPIHTNWIEYPACTDEDGYLVYDIDGVYIPLTYEKNCYPVSAANYYCGGNNWEDSPYCEDQGVLDLEALYPDCL